MKAIQVKFLGILKWCSRCNGGGCDRCEGYWVATVGDDI